MISFRESIIYFICYPNFISLQYVVVTIHRSEDDMVHWITALKGAIKDDKEKMKSLKRGEVIT